MSTYTADDLANLRAAYASGATRVSVSGKMIEYRSLADLERAIATVERSLGTRKTADAALYPGFDRGLS